MRAAPFEPPDTSWRDQVMPTDFNGSEPDISPTETNDALFVANPVWERRGKRRGLGGRKAAAPAPTAAPAPARAPTAAPETRSFAATAATPTPSTLAASEPPLTAPRER